MPPARPLVPPQPQVHGAYAHTLMNPANRSHLLSGQARPHYYGGANYVHPALYGSEGGQELPGGTVPPAPQDGGQVPPGPVQGAEGGDRPMGQGPGAALPARPGQQWQSPPPEYGPKLKRAPQRRRGRKLAYGSGRKPARKHGVSGSDSFNSSPDTGGPGGGSAET
jgi:hypothetical protein